MCQEGVGFPGGLGAAHSKGTAASPRPPGVACSFSGAWEWALGQPMALPGHLTVPMGEGGHQQITEPFTVLA